MKLESKQIQILKRCGQNGHVTILDVYIVYNISHNNKGIGSSNNKYKQVLAKLELLEIFGLLTSKTIYDGAIKEIRWYLTSKGKDVLKENLEELL